MSVKSDRQRGLIAAVEAAGAVGILMRDHLHKPKKMDHVEQHDIKLELDVKSQKMIERVLARHWPGVAVLGEEGVSGSPTADWRWVIDPIDGTVNYTYSIPHACISIALQQRRANASATDTSDEAYETVVGVVYDPFSNELWTAMLGGPAYLNGKKIKVSNRAKLDEAIISMGFSKNSATLDEMLPRFNNLIRRVRKVRIMGAAALAMTYVATGRFEAYWEGTIRLWDIAAGGLILQCAGGEFWHESLGGDHTYRLIATNGLIRRKLVLAAGQLPPSRRTRAKITSPK